LEVKNLLPIPTLTDALVQRKSNIRHKILDTYFVANIWHTAHVKNSFYYSYIDYPTQQAGTTKVNQRFATYFADNILHIF
jgi:hypothetical protein